MSIPSRSKSDSQLRQRLADEGWFPEDEIDAVSGTKHRGRRRWDLPHVMLGNERYNHIDDVLERMRADYERAKVSIQERKRAGRAIA